MASHIIKNAIVCNHCEDEIESTHVHDMRWCSCHRVAVDGGDHYRRRIGEPGDYTEASIVSSLEEVSA